MLRPIHLIPENTKINFLKYKSIFLLGSLAMVIISLLASFIIGLNFGIDFRWGVLLELRSINGNANISELRKIGIKNIMNAYPNHYLLPWSAFKKYNRQKIFYKGEK